MMRSSKSLLVPVLSLIWLVGNTCSLQAQVIVARSNRFTFVSVSRLGAYQSIAQPTYLVTPAGPLSASAYRLNLAPASVASYPTTAFVAQPQLTFVQPTVTYAQPTVMFAQPVLGASQAGVTYVQPTVTYGSVAVRTRHRLRY